MKLQRFLIFLPLGRKFVIIDNICNNKKTKTDFYLLTYKILIKYIHNWLSYYYIYKPGNDSLLPFILKNVYLLLWKFDRIMDEPFMK